jgi:D-alanyl-D-alanine carboxypeptidase
VVKKIPFIIVFLLVIVAGVFIFLPKLFPHNLISPFFQGPDQTEKISKKIATPITLDVAKAKTISSLENIPRYLVYNNNTNKVYYAKGADVRLSPASFT